MFGSSPALNFQLLNPEHFNKIATHHTLVRVVCSNITLLKQETSDDAQQRLRQHRPWFVFSAKLNSTATWFPHYTTTIICCRLCFACCRLCCSAQCHMQITMWNWFHFLLQCTMPISGVVSFWMGPLKGAVIQEFWGKVYYANPVPCVDVCSR